MHNLIGKTNPKSITYAALSFTGAACIGLFVTTTQGVLWEIPSVRVQDKQAGAQVTAAEASVLASRAQIATAEAQKLQAMAAIEQAKADYKRAGAEEVQAHADLLEAKYLGQQVSLQQMEAESTQQVLNPYFVQPLGRIGALSAEISALEGRLQSTSSLEERLKLDDQISRKRDLVEAENKAASLRVQQAGRLVGSMFSAVGESIASAGSYPAQRRRIRPAVEDEKVEATDSDEKRLLRAASFFGGGAQ